MAIATQTIRVSGNEVTVEVTSTLSGTVYFHWYLDGIWQGRTLSGRRMFYLDAGDQARVDVLDTNDAQFDAVANAPTQYPARRLIWWVRSLAADVDHYRVEQKKAGGSWEAVAIVSHREDRWDYSVISERLDDLTQYTWRVVPVDVAGNDGDPVTIGPEQIVRRPDAPNFEITYDSGTRKITFSEAA